jgi:hypothetical protein
MSRPKKKTRLGDVAGPIPWPTLPTRGERGADFRSTNPAVLFMQKTPFVNYKNTKFTSALVYRTEEFETQQQGQLVGSVSVNLAF